MRKHKTVVIIGGGLAGLAAARLLCLRGMTVKLFESNDKLGGCCAATRIGGYTFNDGALFLAMPSMLDQLFRSLQLDREYFLPLRKISTLQRTVLPDGTVVTCDDEVGILIEGNEKKTAQAQIELEAFLKRWDALLHLFSDDILLHPLSLMRLLRKGWRHLYLFGGTAASVLNRGFSDEAVRASLSGSLLFTGMPPDKMPSAALLGLAAMFRQGYFIPIGGMGVIPEVLGSALLESGGEVHLNAKVKRIIVRNGRACGVEVENFGMVEADAVLSTTSGMHTCASLLSGQDAPASMRRKVRNATLSHKGFVLQLGLSNKINTDSYVNNVIPFLGEQQQLFLPDSERLRWPIYMVPTAVVPELAPPHGSIVEVFPPIRQNLPSEEWSEARKEEVAAQVIERLKEMHTIDIAACRILSPHEFQNDTHLYAGALYGLSPLANPTTLFKYRSPIRSLYQAGQTTWPGFGVASAGLSGVMAAETIVHEGIH